MTKTVIWGIIVLAVTITAGIFAFIPIQEASSAAGGNPAQLVRDNIIITAGNGISLSGGDRIVLVDNAGSGGTSDVEVTWRFNTADCMVQTFDGSTFTALNNDGAFGGNPGHADASGVESVVLTNIPTMTCALSGSNHFVTVSTVGSSP